MPTNNTVRFRRRGRRAIAAFTIVEVAFSLVLLAMMGLMVAACCPLITKVSASSNYYSEAVLIAQHKIDQLRDAGWANVVASGTPFSGTGTPPDVTNVTQLRAYSIIDSNDATAPYSFVNVDNLVGTAASTGTAGTVSFFPMGTTATIGVTADQNAGNCAAKSNNCDIVDVTVTISWPSVGGGTNTYTTTAKMIQMPHT